MYDVCYDSHDYNRAINIVQKLVEFKADYREDLVSLYMNTQQFDKALDMINELNETVGKSDKREMYKAQILQDAKYQGAEKANLISKIMILLNKLIILVLSFLFLPDRSFIFKKA